MHTKGAPVDFDHNARYGKSAKLNSKALLLFLDFNVILLNLDC